MSNKHGKVSLVAWVNPVTRDVAREAARLARMSFSVWVERAVMQVAARESALRVIQGDEFKREEVRP